MANVIIPNYVLSGNADPFNVIWKLTRAMKKAGWIYKSSGNGTTKDTSGVAASDLWGGNADPNLDTYPSWSSVSTWWNAQGPSTLKIPITIAQTPGVGGNFIRGENITQSTTGAQGELLGYLFDSSVSAGYLVVLPRIDGSGADPHGWDHAHTITGNVSGATITPSATVIEFVREVVFWKTSGNLTQGATFYQCVDGYSESTSRFSVLALNANCTATVAPGGSASVGNQFPTPGSFVINGTGSAGNPGANPYWFQVFPSTANFSTRSLLIATSATYSSGVSADGSFTAAMGCNSTNAGAFIGFMFTRVDSQEDGDVDPYVWYCPSNQAVYAPVRTSDTSNWNLNATQADFWNPVSVGTGQNFFKFWRRRGWGDSKDAFQNGIFGMLQIMTSVTGYQIMSAWNYQDREKLANTYTDTYPLEDVWCISVQAFSKSRKGICRWLKAVQGGSSMDMYANKTWLQLANSTHSATASTGFVVGPWDGYTSQTQA